MKHQFRRDADWKQRICQELKNRLVGKKVIFYTNTKYKTFMYKSKIVVKDVLFQDKGIVLIDTDDIEYITMLTYPPYEHVSPDITILN